MDPITIPLSAAHKARMAKFEADEAMLHARREEQLTAIVAGHADPDQLIREKWSIDVHQDCVVCTPPAPAQPE